MALAQTVDAVFAPDGPLARFHGRYSPRAGQIAMARAVAITLTEGGQLVVEAGTGVGKTFAYLVPVLMSGRRAIVSTATKALQDQLALRDIPRLLQALQTPVRVSVLKGRSSYLCLNRLGFARQHLDAVDIVNQRQVAVLERWATHTLSGDLAEMPDWPDQSVLEPLVTSTRENCLGSTCPQSSQCFVNRARAAAMEAEVVVVNHHLFFADLNVRESGVAQLLPQTQAVVFDEAHQLNDIGVQFLGQQWSTRQVDALCKDLYKQSTHLAMGSGVWRDWISAVLQSTLQLKAMCASVASGQTLTWGQMYPQGLEESSWQLCIATITEALRSLCALVQLVQESEPSLAQLAARTKQCLDTLEFFAAPVMAGYVRWIECSSHLKMCCSPLDVGKTLALHMEAHEPPPFGPRAWIFTSATLGVDADFALFRNACGLEKSRVLKVDSPFDYADQAALYIPEEFPLPADPLHSLEVAHLAAKAASALGGRTMVLTTSLRAMHTIGAALQQQLAITGRLDVLVQGQLSKQEILSRFSAASDPNQVGQVVVASASFWEGVDIPGDALQLVIIDKIPFLSPDGALTQAREAQIQSRGKSPFRDFHLPYAALGLKQGAGRLIRSESDSGVLVICDPRLRDKSYGKKLLSALPKMRSVTNAQEFQNELRMLTRLSTTDPCWS